MTTFENIKKLILATEINDRVVENSIIMDDNTKQAFKNLSQYTRNSLEEEPKVSSYGLNSLKIPLLTYWNESINPDTEFFWTGLRKSGIDYKREEPLRFALEKNRFRRVDQGMDARKNWNELKKLKEIQDNFTSIEISRIENIIAEDEQRRLDILKKCLRKKEIPQTQYLKFGECMAYMKNCSLWGKYFNENEVEELYRIWKNFKSK
jgi:hypothetical protein